MRAKRRDTVGDLIPSGERVEGEELVSPERIVDVIPMRPVIEDYAEEIRRISYIAHPILPGGLSPSAKRASAGFHRKSMRRV